MGCHYTSGDGEFVGTGNMLRFIGELRLREGLVLACLHIAVNTLMILLTGFLGIYEDNFGSDIESKSIAHLFKNDNRATFFGIACGGTGLMCITIALRLLLWRSSSLALERRAKKALIDIIVATHPTKMSEVVLMNYDFSLEQLTKIRNGDLSDMQLNHSMHEIQLEMAVRLPLDQK